MPQLPANSTPATGDQVVYSYNQVMSSTSILAGWSGASTPVTGSFSRANGQSTVLTITGANLGTVNLGDQSADRYITNSGTILTETATMTMSIVNGRSVVTITFTSTNASLGADTNTTTLVWTPSASAKDPSGNASSVTAVTESASPKHNF